jgi:hypothetical protein
MPSTVSGIIDVIRLNVDHSSLSDAQVLNIVNNGMRRLQRETPYIFEEARVTGTVSTVTTTLQTWSLPSDLKSPVRWYQIISGFYYPVYYEEFHAAIDEFAFSEDSEEPFRYSIHATTGYLFPRLTSASQYEFFYSKLIGDFASVTASNAILETLPEALEYSGTAEYYDYLSEAKRAETWRVKASDAVQALIKQVHWRKENPQTTVPTTYGTIGRQR